MLRVTFSPAPECVEVHCWNWAFPTPRATRALLLLLLLCCTRLNKRLLRECIFWKAIITTLKYFGLLVVIAVVPALTFFCYLWFIVVPALTFCFCPRIDFFVLLCIDVPALTCVSFFFLPALTFFVFVSYCCTRLNVWLDYNRMIVFRPCCGPHI